MKKLFAMVFLSSLLVWVQTVDAKTQNHHKSYHTKKYKRHHMKGFKHDKASHSAMKAMRHLSFLNATDSIPGSSDISSLVSLPEDQGQCGACWDFSLTKALRSEYMVQSEDPGSLEFNYLLNNCGPGPAMGGCNGGSFSAAASFQNGSGPGLNALDPYMAVQGYCKNLFVEATAIQYAMLGNGNGPAFKDLAYAVGVQHHMVSIDVAAGSGDWENYSDGIYNECIGGADDVDHMIDLVGYSCQTSIDSHGMCVFDSQGKPVNGDGYLIVENNWGESWGVQAANGHGGYMKTVMYGSDGTKCNAIANDALIFQIAPHPKPTPTPSPIPSVKPTPIPTPSPSPTPKPVVPCSGFLCTELHCHLPWCSE